MTKYNGIDEREIKCCDPSETTIEAGISFDIDSNNQNVLRFHFLELIELQSGRKIINQVTKSMWLDKNNTDELIKALKSLKFSKKQK